MARLHARRTVSIAFIAVLLTASTIGGCGDAKKSVVGPKETRPFTLEYATSESNLDFFVEGDTANTLMAANPFYVGNQQLPSQKTSEYDLARNKKVAEIKAEADSLVKHSNEIKGKVSALRSSHLDYLTKTFKAEPKLEAFVKESFSEVSLNCSKERLIEAEYKSIDASRADNALARSSLEYLKVHKAVELGSAYLKDVNDVSASSAVALKLLENHKSSKIQSANSQFDGKMQNVLGGLKEDLLALDASTQKIDYGLKQLKTGDHYLSLEGTDFIDSKLPELKAKVQGLKPRQGFTESDIAFARLYLDYFEKLNDALKKQLKATSAKELVSVEEEQVPSGAGYAFAVEPGKSYASAFKAVSAPLKTEEESPGILSQGWSGVKKAVRGAKVVVGVTLDTAGVVVRNISQVPCGIYYGNKPSEIWEDINTNTKEVASNYRNGVSGASTLKTAGEYLEGIEKGAGDAAAWGVEGTIGRGWTSWALGGITKTTVGMFTGLGKGIYKVAKTDATNGEIVEGGLDISLSFIGGSKAILKSSQVIRGLGKEGALVARQGAVSTQNFFNNIAKAGLSKEAAELASYQAAGQLGEAGALRLIDNSLEIQARNAMSKALEESRATLSREIVRVLKEEGRAGLRESAETVRGSLNDLLWESFERNFQEYRRALNTAVGKTPSEYLDNLVGSWIDDAVKGAIKEAIDSGPKPEEISGTWGGTMTIIDVNPKATSAKTSSDDGCDLDFGAMKGQTSKVSWVIALNADGSGTLSAEGKSSPVSYSNGHMTATMSDKGYDGSFDGTFTRTDTGYSGSGSFTLSSKGQWVAKGSWAIAKNR